MIIIDLSKDKKTVNTKKCAKCGKELSLAAFNEDRASKDQLSSYCRECNKSRAKAWRLSHKAKKEDK